MKTCWGNEYPKKIYFDVGDRLGKLWMEFDSTSKEHTGGVKTREREWNALWKKQDEEATKLARPAENVLKAIIKQVAKHSGLKLRFAYENTDYGDSWWDARVPLLDDEDHHYLLTWENCD